MKCPGCHEDNDKVIDSRACDDGFGIRRRRECLSCSRRFTTYERVERASLKVVKRNGTKELFDRQKLKHGLEIACRKRPVTDEQMEEILSQVEMEIETNYGSEVESQFLGEILLKQLYQLDQVAFIRFASVYRQFKDARDFVDVLTPILEEKKKQ